MEHKRLLGKKMHQLVFQKYYPSYNIFLFILHTLKKEVRVLLPSFLLLVFSILHDIKTSSLLSKVLCNGSLIPVSLTRLFAIYGSSKVGPDYDGGALKPSLFR